VLDAAGKVVRTVSSEGPAPGGPGGPQMMPARFGGGGMSRLPKRAGLNRFAWDLRVDGGPTVVPGKYQVKVTAGAWTQTVPLVVRIDPRVAKDGVTPADLQEQYDLLIKVRDALGEARQLQQRLLQAMEKAGVKPAAAPGPGQSPSSIKYDHPLQGLYARLGSAGGVYPQPMLVEQFSNIQRMVGGADQKPGKDAWDRFNDCVKEMNAIRSEADKFMK
jgi:hypothetical protein